MEEQVVIQENSKSKKKLKFKELSKLWKGMVIGLVALTILSFSLAIGYFMVNIFPLLNIMGV